MALVPPSSSSSGSDSSFDERKKVGKKKSSRSKHLRRLVQSVSSDKVTWSMKGFLTGSDILVKNEADKSYTGDKVFRLKVLYATNSHFQTSTTLIKGCSKDCRS